MSAAQGASAATLIMSGGEISGISDLNVDGTNYNVEFVTGSAQSVYGVTRHGNAVTFTFTTKAEAKAAGDAILGVTGITSAPIANANCFTSCEILTPYDDRRANVDAIGAQLGRDRVRDEQVRYDTDLIGAGRNGELWATFSAVPEPADYLLLTAGLAAVGGAARSRRKLKPA